MKEKWGYVCQSCGQNYSKWAGRCQECGAWNSIAEERLTSSSPSRKQSVLSQEDSPKPISQIHKDEIQRIVSDLTELDAVLGGGLVPGSVVLVGGEPGIGKSTLLLQSAHQYAKVRGSVLYVSGEESPSQIALRAQRLKATHDSLLVVSETELEKILAHIEKFKPGVLILDSVQTLHSALLESQPGSVGQLRECSFQIISLAKQMGLPTFLVGHVTKDGAIAGPKILEHMVDVVLYFEGTQSQSFRLLRSIKNRYGSTNEIGVFEMATTGLKSVSNASELFLSERAVSVPGSVVAASMEGTRSLLVEVQALASPTALTIPRRTAIGLDYNRVSLLVAILEKRGGFRLFDQDVYVNVAGGIRLQETASDLAVIAALISSYTNKPIPKETVLFGEVGLGGEVRSVPHANLRLKEAHRIGFQRAVVPKRLLKDLEVPAKMEITAVEHVQELADKL